MKGYTRLYIYYTEQKGGRFMKWVLRKVLSIVVSLVVLLYGVIFILSRFGLEPITVTSSNVCQGITKGDLCFVYEKETYKKGDIVALVDVKDYNFESVVSLNEEGTYNITGNVPVVDKGDIIGKALIKIPFAGYLVFFLTSVNSMDVLIILLAIVILLIAARIIFKILSKLALGSTFNPESVPNVVSNKPEVKQPESNKVYNSLQEFWSVNYMPRDIDIMSYEQRVSLAYDILSKQSNNDISNWLDIQSARFVKHLGASFLSESNPPEAEVMEFWQKVIEREEKFNNMV